MPGVGLLLLRAMLGITALVQGGFYLTAQNNRTIWIWMLGLLAIASGILLLIGFLTPLVGTLTGISAVGTAFSLFPASVQSLQESGVANFYLIIVATTVVLLGPGAISLDARLFGRREIIIPHNPRQPKS